MSLVTENDSQRIEAAIADIERQSATELVVAVVKRSADYWQRRVVIAGTWALGAAFVATVLGLSLDSRWLIVLQAPLAVGLFGLLGCGALLRRLVPASVLAQAVEARAMQLFAARGICNTRHRTGILLMVSELEHCVVILADCGINERVDQGTWQHHVDHLTQSIRQQRTAEGILEVLQACAEVLTKQVPRREGDTNELPNRVVRQ